MINPAKNTTPLSCPSSAFDGTLILTQNGDDYEAGLAPGDYVFKFKVSTGGSDDAHNLEFDITFTLVDPCDPPESVASGILDDQTYIITDLAKDYQFNAATVTPSYCPVEYTYDVVSFDNESSLKTSAVTEVGELERTLRFFYSDDLSPIDQG